MTTTKKQLDDKKYQSFKLYLENNQNVQKDNPTWDNFIVDIMILLSNGELDESYITPLTDRGLVIRQL